MTVLYSPVISQDDVQTTLRAFLLSVLPAGVQCFEGQDNRVGEPSNTDFVIMSVTLRERLETNVDLYADAAFSGSVAGNTLTVGSVQFGTVQPGVILYGTGMVPGTMILSQVDGTPGGAGHYTLSTSQTVAGVVLAAGLKIATVPTMLTFQLDFHSAAVLDSGDMAQTVTTLFRDETAVTAMLQSNPGVTPLYASDPRQIPFMNSEQQYETRWTVDATLQANLAINVPQQFAGIVTVHSYDEVAAR